MSMEVPSSSKQPTAQESQEQLTEQMRERWEQVNGKVFAEAVADAETVEDLVAAVKTCGIKELRSYNAGQKVIRHEHGVFVSADELANYIPQYAVALKSGDSNVLYGMSDVGIPEMVKQRLREIITPEEGE